MIKKETLALILVGGLIVLPAIGSLTAYAITKNPSLRPLNITFDSLSEAGQLNNNGEIIAVISTGANATRKLSKADQTRALRTTFQRYQTDVQVKFRKVPGSTDSTITYLVGESRIGPYPLARAAAGVAPAAQAERMLKAQQASVIKALQAEQARDQSFWSWLRVFD